MSCLFVNSDKPLVDEMVCALLLCLQDYSASGPSFGFNLVGPPWTLTYEVLFYFIFGLAMAISPRYRSYLCTLLILLLTIGLQLIFNGHYQLSSQASPTIEVHHAWQALIKLASNTVMYEFVFGMLAAELLIHDRLPPRSGTLALLCIGMWLTGWGSAIYFNPQSYGMTGGFWMAALIYVGMIVLDYHYQFREIKVLSWLGNISYSLYLVHYPLMMYLIPYIPQQLTVEQKLLVFFGIVSLSLIIATVLYSVIEKPFIAVGRTLCCSMKKAY